MKNWYFPINGFKSNSHKKSWMVSTSRLPCRPWENYRPKPQRASITASYLISTPTQTRVMDCLRAEIGSFWARSRSLTGIFFIFFCHYILTKNSKLIWSHNVMWHDDKHKIDCHSTRFHPVARLWSGVNNQMEETLFSYKLSLEIPDVELADQKYFQL